MTVEKTIFITGAGSGFGREAALRLSRLGHEVIAGTHNLPQVTTLLDTAKKEGLQLRVEKVDILNPIDRNFALRWDIDVLVNNAAIPESGPIAEIPIRLLRDVFETNVFAALELTQGFVKKMVERGNGKVIFVSSMGGLTTFPFVGAYCASKHAIEAIAEAMHVELAPHGVKVATLNPGAYQTGFNEQMVNSMWRWFDPKVNFTNTDILKEFNNMHQYDPKDLVEAMINLIVSDESKFRNVHPKETELFLKDTQEKAWTIMS
ncbi:MAG TPA: SDR family oxidoreductase [Nitrososphaeraceae archaeon]|nr:SDR family oxidoreductase [Nitrososphaeraceae archaeon]